ncbi:hypothetical protein HYE68_000542 [Fusarium pseudograminearum]|nr:hypothetical protein HYE68_000542 [Fusarium pseudograminearum]
MAPTIHLVRHAQGVHNLPNGDDIPDPDLTPLGEEQCASLREKFPYHDKITKLFASPMRRTIYTCFLAFGTKELNPIIPLPVLQEVSALPCDTGSSVATVQAEFAGIADYSQVEENWTDKGPDSEYYPTIEKLEVRGRKARNVLRDLVSGDEHIVVVSHGGFLHLLTDDWYGVPEGQPNSWSNCEFRSYQFVDPTGKDEDAAMFETAESWRRRWGDAKPPTAEESRRVKPIAQKGMMPIWGIIMPN